MTSRSIKISDEAINQLREIRNLMGKRVSNQQIVENAVDRFRGDLLLQKANEEYAALKGNPELSRIREDQQAAHMILEQDRLARMDEAVHLHEQGGLADV